MLPAGIVSSSKVYSAVLEHTPLLSPWCASRDLNIVAQHCEAPKRARTMSNKLIRLLLAGK